MVLIQSQMENYADEHNIEYSEGETYHDLYQKILDSNPSLHTREELHKYGEELLDQLIKEYGLKATYVFAYYPIIATPAYHGFDEVYLYEHIHSAMGCTASAFCKMNKINEKFDKQFFEFEFSNVFNEKYGFLKLGFYYKDTNNLLSYMELLKNHFFDYDYLALLEEDIKKVLVSLGDNYIHTLDLKEKDNILFLYEVCGIFYGFNEYRIDIFQDYDGYGNVVSTYNEELIVNDLSYYKD